MARIVAIGANLKDWKRKKKSSRKKTKKQLDKLFSIIIRSEGKCERCGKASPLNTAHIFSRRNLAIRWDKDNVFCFCVGCHFWAHQNPVLFTEFVKKKFGIKKYEGLKRKSEQIKKWTIPELEELVEEFKKEINNNAL